MADTPKFKQICVGQYATVTGHSFSVIGLDEDGKVWQFKRDGWVRLEEVRTSYSKPQPSQQEPGW